MGVPGKKKKKKKGVKKYGEESRENTSTNDSFAQTVASIEK